jgi:hypothetical protein
MTGQQTNTANAQQSYTLASRTSQRTDQSLPKSMPAPTQEKIQNIFSCPSKKIKTPDTQADTTKTVKLNTDNGLQGRWTRTPAANSTYKKLAVQWLNEALCLVSSSVVADSFVLRNRQLLIAAKR